MTTEPNNTTAEKTGNGGHLSNKELNTIWLRWAFTHLASMSYEKLQGHALRLGLPSLCGEVLQR